MKIKLLRPTKAFSNAPPTIDIPDFDPPMQAILYEGLVFLRQDDGSYLAIDSWTYPTTHPQPSIVHLFIDDYTTLCGIYERHHPWGGGTLAWRYVTCPDCKKLKNTSNDPHTDLFDG